MDNLFYQMISHKLSCHIGVIESFSEIFKPIASNGVVEESLWIVMSVEKLLTEVTLSTKAGF